MGDRGEPWDRRLGRHPQPWEGGCLQTEAQQGLRRGGASGHTPPAPGPAVPMPALRPLLPLFLLAGLTAGASLPPGPGDHPGVCPNQLSPNLWVDAQSTCERECGRDQVSPGTGPLAPLAGWGQCRHPGLPRGSPDPGDSSSPGPSDRFLLRLPSPGISHCTPYERSRAQAPSLCLPVSEDRRPPSFSPDPPPPVTGCSRRGRQVAYLDRPSQSGPAPAAPLHTLRIFPRPPPRPRASVSSSAWRES